ncbi:MAG TPA: uroporphyrinogen-III C-methyltransferase [Sphingobacterium sp.]|mgnify:CR=1 FL=1|nr:uroporphyrinogen-III C-methyltransferase [Sphingobacterium sp.]
MTEQEYIHIKPKVTLVGAGPGDPDLITLKGIKAIQEADVILFDALVNEKILEFAKPASTKIYVGKRAEQLSTSQDYINKLMVDYALTHGHVVRLKGGDPFVFGRGGEELDYIRQFDIETAVIPGISSSVGLTGLQQIPLTYRGISESFWVITGSTSDGRLSEDLYTAVKTNATVVVLMGYSKLQQIIALYQENGRGNLPIALIQNGSLPNERIALGTINTILEQVHKNLLGVPAIIVLGEVVSKHREFQKLRQEIQHIEA